MAVGIFKILKPLGVGSSLIFRWIIRHYYLFILALVLIPAIFGSISQAIEEKNPVIPFVELGIVLTNADANIAEDMKTLKETPEELVGVKPDVGIVRHIKYYFNWIKFWFRIGGWIWAIAFPFVIFYRLFRIQGSKGFQSSKSADFTKAVILGLLLIFVVNLLMITTGFLDGSLVSTFSEEATQFQRAGLVALQALPFHGVASLIIYLIGLSR